MSAALRDIAQLTPLGASVHALQMASQATFPSAESLLVMLAWGVGFALLAVKSFRWE